MLIGEPARRHGRYTIFEAELEQPDVYRRLSRCTELNLALVAVRPDASETPWVGPQTHGCFEHAYVVRPGGHVAEERQRPAFDCAVRHEPVDTVVVARLDRAGVERLLRLLRQVGADLLSVCRKP